MYVKHKTVEWSEKVVDEVGYFFVRCRRTYVRRYKHRKIREFIVYTTVRGYFLFFTQLAEKPDYKI